MPRLRLLFVCSGNICRSPMAEALMRHKAAQRGLDIEVDGAGTGSWHAGEEADRRTLHVLRRYGVPEPSLARQFKSSDFEDFDHIFAMDGGHMDELLRWPGAKPEKVSLFLNEDSVLDPYGGTLDDFDDLYRVVDRGTDAILAKLP